MNILKTIRNLRMKLWLHKYAKSFRHPGIEINAFELMSLAEFDKHTPNPRGDCDIDREAMRSITRIIGKTPEHGTWEYWEDADDCAYCNKRATPCFRIPVEYVTPEMHRYGRLHADGFFVPAYTVTHR
ncbi:hypothetical protein pEaSNUABM9_00264 [Erwinia phage pEa_SNUABM_9]|nr:hypothetical protein pEaSNUABM9_00264 [Erwinia phage pEa_SNUABM_9]